MDDLVTAVTALFVPGDRPARFAPAAASGADVVLIDLEDAVAPGEKASARRETLTALTPRGADAHVGAVGAVVRINAPGTREGEEDLVALRSLVGRPDHGLLGVMVPKSAAPTALAEVVDVLAGAARAADAARVPVLALVESAAGVLAAADLANVDGVVRLALGAQDLALDLDVAPTSPAVDHARAHLVLASRAAGIAAPLDSPPTELADMEVVASTARRARAHGFGGLLCIHPRQVSPAWAAFVPDAEEVAWAESVVALDGAAVAVEGQMVDRPVVDRARRVLARAGR